MSNLLSVSFLVDAGKYCILGFLRVVALLNHRVLLTRTA